MVVLKREGEREGGGGGGGLGSIYTVLGQFVLDEGREEKLEGSKVGDERHCCAGS